MRGQGRIFHPTWTDPATGKRKAAKTWRLDYSVNGKRHEESAHTTNKREALALLHQRLGARRGGTLTGNPDTLTLAQLRAGLLRHYTLEGNRSSNRAEDALDHLEEYFDKDCRARELTPERVSAYLESRIAAKAARATACYEVRILGAAFGVAVAQGQLATRPVFRLPRVENVRQGFFTEADLAALLLELPADVRPVVEFLHGTGWRLREALNLTWDAVEWEGHTVRLGAGDTKARAGRVFPFGAAPSLKGLLETQWAHRDGLFVFHRRGKRIKTFRDAWHRACLRAGLAGKHVHDLRRSAARDFRRAGVSETEIMALCGWKTASMFRRYDIITEGDLAAAAAKRFNGQVTSKSEAPAVTPS